MNIFRDVFAAVRDVVGGQSAATQKALRDARKTVLSELRREALMVGAHAVLAIDLDDQELSGGNKSGMLMIVASGTAVKLEGFEKNRVLSEDELSTILSACKVSKNSTLYSVVVIAKVYMTVFKKVIKQNGSFLAKMVQRPLTLVVLGMKQKDMLN